MLMAAKPTPPPPGIAVRQAVDSGFIPEGERKLVTALFVDIINSTGLEQDLDPEEARAIIDPALGLMIDSVRRYGHVVQSTGDGVFALLERRLLTKTIRNVRSTQHCGYRRTFDA